MLKIMVMQHAVQYHEARDWICLQDQSQLTYQSVVSSIRRSRRGDELTSWPLMQQPPQHLLYMPIPYLPMLTATNVATPTPNKCPARGWTCYACSGLNHYTALCKWKKTQWPSCNTAQRDDKSPRGARSHKQARSPGKNRSRHRGCHSSQSLSRQSCHYSPSHSKSHSTSHSPSCSASPYQCDRSYHWQTLCGTPRTASRSSQQTA